LKIYGRDPKEVEDLVRRKAITTTIYGLGYIGLATAAAYLSKGFKVVGYDPNKGRAEEVERGDAGHPDPEVREAIARGARKGLLEVARDPVEAAKRGDVILVDVPLAWGPRGPSFEHIDAALSYIAAGLSPGSIVVIETTVPPGTTSARARRALEEGSGLRCGREFGLAHSPARLGIERAFGDLTRRYPKIVGGVDRESPKALEPLFREVYGGGVIVMSSATAAEFEKVVEGVYRDVNIALANELARAARELGIDVWEVIEASRTNPYVHIHLPGSGVGGVSLPYQPYLLAWSVGKSWIWDGVAMRARRANEAQPSYIARALLEGLEILGVDPKSSRIAILGLAYKGDVEDHRNSPTYGLVEHLLRAGVGDIVVHDPYVGGAMVGARLSPNLYEALRGCRGVIVSTDHSVYRGLSTAGIAGASGSGKIAILDARRVLKKGGAEAPGGVECIYSTAGSPWEPCF